MGTSIEGFKAAIDIAKQVIALSTGAVAFTVTFLDKFVSRPTGQAAAIPASLYVAWVLFGAAIFFAMFQLMGITGSLESIDRKANGWPLTPEQETAASGGHRASALAGRADAVLLPGGGGGDDLGGLRRPLIAAPKRLRNLQE